MITTKTVMLAALAALSLGVGTAKADGPDGSSQDYQSRTTLKAAMNASAHVDHGSSQAKSGSSHVNPTAAGNYFQYGAQQ